MSRIKIYTCQAMTGRFMDELVVEAQMLKRTLENHGFGCLNPVLEESVPNVHEILINIPAMQLESTGSAIRNLYARPILS